MPLPFKIGDVVKLKDDIHIDYYEQFLERKITKDHKLKVSKVCGGDGGLGFEGGWENHTYHHRFFELTTNRKERINNLFKEI